MSGNTFTAAASGSNLRKRVARARGGGIQERETHQLLGGLVLEGGGGDLVLLRQELVVVRLLEVELDIL